MRKASLTMLACATLLSTGAALAVPTAQQKCDYTRITAWKAYASCVNTVIAKDAKGLFPSSSDVYLAFGKCRHNYFKKWASLQGKAYAGSTCDLGLADRFTDNVDGSVTDNLSGLVWELKDELDNVADFNNPHDADNSYSWSTGVPWAENGGTFTSFLTDATTGLNVTGFAGASGWRIPTLAELQTIMLDFACTKALCTCPSSPCVDPALDPANTELFAYWSATTYTHTGFSAESAWVVDFGSGVYLGPALKSIAYPVRAVRGGL